MTKFSIALAAAGFLLAAPTFSTPASATVMSDAVEQHIQLAPGMQLAQINVRIGDDRRGYRHRDHRYRQNMRHRDRCTTNVVYRHGRRVLVQRCR